MPRKRKGPPGLRGRPTKWNPAVNLKHLPKTIVTHTKKHLLKSHHANQICHQYCLK